MKKFLDIELGSKSEKMATEEISETAICPSKAESEFWTHPLGKWLESCLGFPELAWPSHEKLPISYVDLCNAAILNALLLYM